MATNNHPTPPPAETTERQMVRDFLMTERQTTIMRLRRLDTILIEMGAINEPTIKTHGQRRAERRNDKS